ncbi:MAG: efflux RND transporter periplasmic adaptor subunit [Candidatus Puniceispirillaceae bacterium]
MAICYPYLETNLSGIEDNKLMMLRNITKQLAYLMIGMVLFNAPQAGAQQATGVPVITSYVEQEIVSDTTKTPGAIVAPPAIIISALRSEQLMVAPLQIGGFIRKGAQIATQNTDDLETQKELLLIQISDAEADMVQITSNIAYEQALLDVAESQLVIVSQKAERAKQLVAKKAISPEAGETAQSATLTATQQVILRKQAIDRLQSQKTASMRTIQRLNLQIDQINTDIEQATYVAPENGLILSLAPYRLGFARQGDVIAQIQGFMGFEVEAEIPSTYLSFLQTAPNVKATDANGNDIDLIFRSALPQEDRRTATRPVRFTIASDLPRSLSADGARLDIQVPIREAEDSLLVPQDAILPVAGGHIVYVFDDSKAVRQIVRLGGTVGDKVIILSGLAEGERVIIKGNEGLSDGVAVKEGRPPKRKVAAAGDEAEEEVAEAVLETELADDAVAWLLEWKTPRGDSSAELTLSSKANLYDGEPIFVTKQGDKLSFSAERVLPFGILTFAFEGTISGQIMSGTITMSGLPNGRTPSFPFEGKVK